MNTVNKWVQIVAVATIAMAGCKKDLLPAASVPAATVAFKVQTRSGQTLELSIAVNDGR